MREESPQDIWEDIAERLENVFSGRTPKRVLPCARPSLSSSETAIAGLEAQALHAALSFLRTKQTARILSHCRPL